MGSPYPSSHSQSYAPSAPSLPPPPPSSFSSTTDASSSSYNYYDQSSSSYWQPRPRPPPPNYGYGGGGFPPGTHPEVVRSFEMVDGDRSGFIDENELQLALSSGYQRFHMGTIRLLMFLFRNPDNRLRIGPREFAALWSCLGQWRLWSSRNFLNLACPRSSMAWLNLMAELRKPETANGIFERYDRDRSGKIDLFELRDALYGLGYAIPPSVLKVLMSKYDDGSGRKIELNFDSFVECGMIVKGLTEKFKEKDRRYSGSATFNYDEFMTMVIPFLVAYD